MEPHGQSPWYLHKIPSYAKASEGYPPSAKSAEAAILQLMNIILAQFTLSSTGKARGRLRRRIKKPQRSCLEFLCDFHILELPLDSLQLDLSQL